MIVVPSVPCGGSETSAGPDRSFLAGASDQVTATIAEASRTGVSTTCPALIIKPPA
jgi:hypothetical protein